MSVMIVQTKCKLNNIELFHKLFHIQCKEIGNNTTAKKQKQFNFLKKITVGTIILTGRLRTAGTLLTIQNILPVYLHIFISVGP